MPGASEQTSQVKVLNVNWTAGANGEDGPFEVMIVTAGLLTAGYAASLRRGVRRQAAAEDRNSVSRKDNTPVRSEN